MYVYNHVFGQSETIYGKQLKYHSISAVYLRQVHGGPLKPGPLSG